MRRAVATAAFFIHPRISFLKNRFIVLTFTVLLCTVGTLKRSSEGFFRIIITVLDPAIVARYFGTSCSRASLGLPSCLIVSYNLTSTVGFFFRSCKRAFSFFHIFSFLSRGNVVACHEHDRKAQSAYCIPRRQPRAQSAKPGRAYSAHGAQREGKKGLFSGRTGERGERTTVPDATLASRQKAASRASFSWISEGAVLK